jgi:hypothetical protein
LVGAIITMAVAACGGCCLGPVVLKPIVGAIAQISEWKGDQYRVVACVSYFLSFAIGASVFFFRHFRNISFLRALALGVLYSILVAPPAFVGLLLFLALLNEASGLSKF